MASRRVTALDDNGYPNSDSGSAAPVQMSVAKGSVPSGAKLSSKRLRFLSALTFCTVHKLSCHGSAGKPVHPEDPMAESDELSYN